MKFSVASAVFAVFATATTVLSAPVDVLRADLQDVKTQLDNFVTAVAPFGSGATSVTDALVRINCSSRILLYLRRNTYTMTLGDSQPVASFSCYD